MQSYLFSSLFLAHLAFIEYKILYFMSFSVQEQVVIKI